MKEQLQKDFDNTIRNLTLSQKDIEIKKFYLDNFINKGFPNRKEEDWKFSDLKQIINKNIGEISIPIIVRLQGTNSEEGSKIIEDSGLKVFATNTLQDAADKVNEILS